MITLENYATDHIFEYLLKNKDHVNYMVRKDAIKGRKFSDVYHILFPPVGFTAALDSFLKTLYSFEFKKETNDVIQAKQAADEIYSNLGIPTWPEMKGAHDFLVYLIWVYPKVVKTYENYCSGIRFDNMFGFMDRFEIEKTRVVIIGQDPSPNCQSSGYAFHGSKCYSTEKIIDFLNMEFHIADVYNNCPKKLAFCETDSYKRSCRLDGWIDQNVLMFNTFLTLSHPPKSGPEISWLKFTMFLVKTFCKIHTNLVFILTGGKAEQMAALIKEVNLNENKKHAVFCVLHPNYKKALWDRTRPLDLTKWGTKHWNVDLPFLNTNFYLYQLYSKFDHLIDWHHISKSTQTANQQRFDAWRKLFQNLLALANQAQQSSTVCIEVFVISGVKKVFQLKRNSITGFYEMRCIDA